MVDTDHAGLVERLECRAWGHVDDDGAMARESAEAIKALIAERDSWAAEWQPITDWLGARDWQHIDNAEMLLEAFETALAAVRHIRAGASELATERNHWKLRAEAAEASLEGARMAALAFGMSDAQVCECGVCHEPAICRRRPTGTWACKPCDAEVSRLDRVAELDRIAEEAEAEAKP